MSTEEVWRLSWKMMENSWDKNYEAVDIQFNSLLLEDDNLDTRFILAGLEAKLKIGKKEEVVRILNTLSKTTLSEICKESFLLRLDQCKCVSEELVENKALQLELIKMYAGDQFIRGNIMVDIITRYNLNPQEVGGHFEMMIDENNTARLKEIIKEFGFPTKKMVGGDAMQGVFLIIQHSDLDEKWQESQLKNIKLAVEAGDLDGQKYAFLYDRIKVNHGEKQLYGTQFVNVDSGSIMVKLGDTEDLVNLDKRRREMGMMPIEMYKKFLLNN